MCTGVLLPACLGTLWMLGIETESAGRATSAHIGESSLLPCVACFLKNCIKFPLEFTTSVDYTGSQVRRTESILEGVNTKDPSRMFIMS